MLVVALLSLVLFPYHYHLSHIEGPLEVGAATHVVDSHLHVGIEDAGADDYHTVESSTDITLKSPAFPLPLFAILFVFAFVLPLNKRLQRQMVALRDQVRPAHLPYSSPPLRAPPRR